MDLTKFSKGKRMVREDLIKEIGENAAELKQKVNFYKVDTITSISDEILSKMKAGDIVLKKTGDYYHSYIVSFKKDDEGICLTYTDASIVETVSYDLVGTTWTYNSTDVTPIGEFNKVVANPTLAGTEPQLEGLEVGGTKYAMPSGGGDLYLHSLIINTASYSSGVYRITLLLKRDTAFTSPQDLIQYLHSLTQADNIIGYGVFVTEQNADFKIFGLSVAYDGSYLRYRYRDGATNNIPATGLEDTVTKL